jgi:hypothetical protein
MPFPRLSTCPGSLARIFLILALFSPALPTVSAQQGYPAKIRAARLTWERDSRTISQLLGKLRDHATTCNRLDKEIARSEGEIRQVEEDLAEQLREMAEGRFCSECLRSASELERGGEPFLYHVRKVQGTAIPASPEQFEQARQKAAEKIASLRRRLNEQQGEKKKESGLLSSALHELLVTTAAYHRDITTEKDLQVAYWASEANGLEKKLMELQDELDTLAKQPAVPARDVQIRAADAQMRSSLTSASTAESRARQTATAFNQAVRRDMDDLAKKAETIPPGQPLVDGWQIGKSITSQNITYVAGSVRRPQASSAAQYLKGAPKPASTPAPAKSVSDLLKGK